MSASRAGSLGQMLILGVHDHLWSAELERSLREVQPAGALLYPEALRTPGQTAELLSKIARALDSAPILAIEAEGGRVDPLRAFLPPLSAPGILARRGPAAVRRAAELCGAALKLLGFNLNFAPRLDLSNPGVELGHESQLFAPRLDLSNPGVEPALESQIFGADPKQVTEFGKAFAQGLARHNILACGKHFPGRSFPEYDDHGLPVIGKAMAELWREDLLPFRELLPYLPFLKVSNVAYKAYDFGSPQPASMSSRVLRDLLRTKLGYGGVTVASLMELLWERAPHLTGEYAAAMNVRDFPLSIKAGCDLQVFMWVPKMMDRFLNAMQKGLQGEAQTEDQVEEALRRIRAAKKGLTRPTGKLSAQNFERLAREFEKFERQVKAGEKVEV